MLYMYINVLYMYMYLYLNSVLHDYSNFLLSFSPSLLPERLVPDVLLTTLVYQIINYLRTTLPNEKFSPLTSVVLLTMLDASGRVN